MSAAGSAAHQSRRRCVSGQKICRDGLDVSIDGIVIAQAQARLPGPIFTRAARMFPPPSEPAFLLNRDEPASLDERYFRAFPAEIVIGRAVSIWTRVDD